MRDIGRLEPRLPMSQSRPSVTNGEQQIFSPLALPDDLTAKREERGGEGKEKRKTGARYPRDICDFVEASGMDPETRMAEGASLLFLLFSFNYIQRATDVK
jgi:hypothetical protein